MDPHEKFAELLHQWHTYVATEREAGRDPLSPYTRRHQKIRTHVKPLREYPPSFDSENLDAVLSQLESAKRVRNQIVEANELDVLVPTLRAFLFGDDPVAERFARTLPNVRYAGPAVLGELFGWVHADEWPVPTAQTRAVLEYLTEKPAPHGFVDVAKYVRRFERQYRDFERLAPDLPLNVELIALFDWAADRIPSPAYTQAHGEPPGVVHAIREFGAPYRTPQTAGLADRPLTRPRQTDLHEAEAEIRKLLVLPPDTIRRAAAHLLAGRHLILTGAPGTGKSHLAMLLTSHVFGYYPMVVTATAEWSAFDVVGGLVPAADSDGLLHYEVRPGYVYEALRQNWLLDDDDTLQRDAGGEPLRRHTTVDGKQWQGVWLIIDELNRADIDKAFGDLFTALETNRLRVPALGTERSQLIPLPKDFRIIATLNTQDRHFLFTLSDALKRRFAFLQLTPPDLDRRDDEAETVLRRATDALRRRDVPVERAFLCTVLDRLHPIILFIRAFHPLGTAPLLASLEYAGAAHTLDSNTPIETLAAEAFSAEITPQLEAAEPASLHIVEDVLNDRKDDIFTRIAQHAQQQSIDDAPLQAAGALATWLQVAARQQDDQQAANVASQWAQAIERTLQDAGWSSAETVQRLRDATAEARTLSKLLPDPLYI